MKFSKLFKVKEGKLDTLREWFEVLSGDRKEETIATFEYENVSREVFVLFQGQEGDHYVIGLNEVTGEHKKGDPEVKIYQEHTKILKECLEPVSERGEILLDLGI
jgi:hypothetical protein